MYVIVHRQSGGKTRTCGHSNAYLVLDFQRQAFEFVRHNVNLQRPGQLVSSAGPPKPHSLMGQKATLRPGLGSQVPYLGEVNGRPVRLGDLGLLVVLPRRSPGPRPWPLSRWRWRRGPDVPGGR
jgi:hypothetical protein